MFLEELGLSVDPQHFVNAMKDRWTSSYGLTSSLSLEKAWYQMAVTFNSCIAGEIFEDDETEWVYPSGKQSGKNEQSQWSILRMPTGTGKTEGLCLYCSLLSQNLEHPGVLIVTKFTKEIERIVATINRHPYKATALADYYDIKPKRHSREEIKASPVLAITHSVYGLALDAQSQDKESVQSGRFTEWNDGVRKLVIIDESLDVVVNLSLNVDALKIIRAWIPRQMERDYSKQVSTFDKFIKTFYDYEENNLPEFDRAEISRDFWSTIDKEDLLLLQNELCKLPLSEIVVGRTGVTSLKARCEKVFSDIFNVLDNRSWFEIRKGLPNIVTSYVGLPTHIKNAVVLDATAAQSKIYDLLGSLPYFPQLPQKIRNYKNVNLHVIKGSMNSEYSLSRQNKEHFLDVVNLLRPEIKKSKKFLFITFASIERDKLSLLKKGYPNCQFAHWGDINGKNSWSDLDTVVLYGLPRLGDGVVENSIIAFENWHEKTQIHVEPIGHLEDMDDGSLMLSSFDNIVTKEDYHIGHITMNVIQAINRICCRRVIDGDGNCPPANVYLFLKDSKGIEKRLLQGIKQEMDGINELYSEQGNVQKLEKLPKAGQKILEYLSRKPKGSCYLHELRMETGVPKGTLEKYVRLFRDERSAFGRAMREIGIVEVTEARGRKKEQQSFSKS